jgi:hypothetical protein
MSLEPIPIFGNQTRGLKTNKKPYLLQDGEFPVLENAYSWRDRVIKREGNKFLSRLTRVLAAQSLGNTPVGVTTITFADIFATIGGFTGENPELQPGTISITIAAPDTSTFIDNGDGSFSVTGLGISAGSYVNYSTGTVVLKFSVPTTGGSAITIDFNYFPSLPVMGIEGREIAGITDLQTLWFDTKYAYNWNGSQIIEYLPATGTTWDGTDADFFWTTNYRGTSDSTRLLFVTNFVNTATNPMRYTDGGNWFTFQPIIADNPPSAAQSVIYSARIIIPYYGRLVLLNTWEGTTAGGNAGASNFFNRCAFSQIGDPTAADAFRRDIVGKGGSIDAPTNEEIVGAGFIKNTLMVFFSETTWQLRYVGEYGIPFIWERISADLGSDSTFSTVIFDQGALVVGDKAIISSDPNQVNRIDLDIPDQIFEFRTAQEGAMRVQGIRNFQKEVVYWTYPDFGLDRKFPNRVLLFNYRNNTFAKFRDNVTAFGTFFLTDNAVTTWDSTDVFWDDDDVTWDDPEVADNFPSITSGNQEGFVHIYAETFPDEESLSITAIDLTQNPIQITVNNHNLEDGDFVYMQHMQFIDTATSTPVLTNLNDVIYKVQRLTPGDPNEDNIINLLKFDGEEYVYLNYTNFPSLTPTIGSATYIGGGTLALFPKLDVQTKDFSPYANRGIQVKMSYFDFLMEATETAAVTINLYINTSPAVSGNLLVGNRNMTTAPTLPYYVPASDIAWYRFYATCFGQFIRIQMTYSDELMSMLSTHQQGWQLNSITLWARKGGRQIF